MKTTRGRRANGSNHSNLKHCSGFMLSRAAMGWPWHVAGGVLLLLCGGIAVAGKWTTKHVVATDVPQARAHNSQSLLRKLASSSTVIDIKCKISDVDETGFGSGASEEGTASIVCLSAGNMMSSTMLWVSNFPSEIAEQHAAEIEMGTLVVHFKDVTKLEGVEGADDSLIVTQATTAQIVVNDGGANLPFGGGSGAPIVAVETTVRPSVTGIRRVVLVWVTSADGIGPSFNQEEWRARLFGDEPGHAGMRAQFLACSAGQLSFDYVETIELAAPQNMDTYQDRYLALSNQAKGLLIAHLAQRGITDGRDLADHYMFVLPPGTGTYWNGIGTVNDWRTVFNDRNALSLINTMHELGHNIGLGHSGEGDEKYGDETGYMGYGMMDEEIPLKCFNAVHHYELGWFQKRELFLDGVNAEAGVYELATFVDYDKTNNKQYVLINVGNQFMLQYNRAKLFNVGTEERPDTVTIIHNTGAVVGWTLIQTGLSVGETWATVYFLWTNPAGQLEYRTLVIQACAQEHISASSDRAVDSMWVSVGFDRSYCEDFLSPTSAPTQPTSVPTMTAVPSTIVPTSAPSTTVPTPAPTSRPPTVQPKAPTTQPSLPTGTPTALPSTIVPTSAPSTTAPTPAPTSRPPTVQPKAPTTQPSLPTGTPTALPSFPPSSAPVAPKVRADQTEASFTTVSASQIAKCEKELRARCSCISPAGVAACAAENVEKFCTSLSDDEKTDLAAKFVAAADCPAECERILEKKCPCSEPAGVAACAQEKLKRNCMYLSDDEKKYVAAEFVAATDCPPRTAECKKFLEKKCSCSAPAGVAVCAGNKMKKNCMNLSDDEKNDLATKFVAAQNCPAVLPTTECEDLLEEVCPCGVPGGRAKCFKKRTKRLEKCKSLSGGQKKVVKANFEDATSNCVVIKPKQKCANLLVADCTCDASGGVEKCVRLKLKKSSTCKNLSTDQKNFALGILRDATKDCEPSSDALDQCKAQVLKRCPCDVTEGVKKCSQVKVKKSLCQNLSMERKAAVVSHMDQVAQDCAVSACEARLLEKCTCSVSGSIAACSKKTLVKSASCKSLSNESKEIAAATLEAATKECSPAVDALASACLEKLAGVCGCSHAAPVECMTNKMQQKRGVCTGLSSDQQATVESQHTKALEKC